MEALQTNVVKVGDLTKKTLEEVKKRSETPMPQTTALDEFNLVTYIDGERVVVGQGWMNTNTGRRPKLQIFSDVAKFLEGNAIEAWFFPKNKRKKEDKK